VVQQTYKQGRQWLEEADVVDVDQEVDRTAEELDLEAAELVAVRAGVGIRGALVRERVHLNQEEIRQHLTEELPYLKQEEHLHLRELHLRGRLQRGQLNRELIKEV